MTEKEAKGLFWMEILLEALPILRDYGQDEPDDKISDRDFELHMDRIQTSLLADIEDLKNG